MKQCDHLISKFADAQQGEKIKNIKTVSNECAQTNESNRAFAYCNQEYQNLMIVA